MKKLSVLFVSVVVLGMLVAPAGAAGIITVISVSNNGKTITVKGLASLPGKAAALLRPKLIADAGDTSVVQVGEKATLIGTAHGGAAPYRFKWSSPVGSLDGATSDTALLDATKVKTGLYKVALTVTDSAGKTATDTSKLIVIPNAEDFTVSKQDKADPTPGVTGASTVAIDFNTPPGVDLLDITVSWDRAVNDYDLTVVGPDGKKTTGSGGIAGEPELATVAKPKPGHWQLVLDKYATVGDTLHALVIGTPISDDPRPAISAGGPYRFLIGTAQKLEAKVTDGAKPYQIGWDFDGDGLIDARGAKATAQLPQGRNLVTAYVVDGKGLARRQTTSVLVATKERLHLDTAAITVIGIADTGINPYHLQYSATTYPDPDVLALTKNFTRHPSEYIPGYPTDAEAIPITLGKGYFPKADKALWDHNKFIKPGHLYWIPGTKIIGAVATAKASDGDPHPILDDEGHGSGTTSVSTGNTYGYCPTCLVVIVEGLNIGVKEAFPWVDISSNSFGPSFGLPTALLNRATTGSGADSTTKAAVERGQTVLFAAGNGLGNFFDVPQLDWFESYTGMPWNISVGALRRDNQRAIVGDGIPVHLSAWGDGDLPSACRTGDVSHCSFGGTSAATPYTAGVFGTVLSEIRRQLGDPRAGQKDHQVVAEGVAIPGSPYLSDGKLTRAELREVVLKTTEPLNQGNNYPDYYVHSVAAPYIPMVNVLFEGYGAATPNSARRAIDVLMGRTPLPDRSFEDLFFSVDDLVKTTLYGSYDSDGDGKENAVSRPAGFHVSQAEVATYAGTLAVIQRAMKAQAGQASTNSPSAGPQPQAQETFSVIAQPIGHKPLVRYLHRIFSDPEITPSDETPGLLPSVPPGIGIFIPNTTTVRCNEENNQLYMDSTDTKGDLDPCFNSRVSSVIANFRPVQSWASTEKLKAPLPAGSNVHVELFMAGETPSIVIPTGVLVATDREIGIGGASPGLVLPAGLNGTLCDALGDACWTKYDFDFNTTRPAFTGEELTFQVQLLGARSWAFGYEGTHASKLTITPSTVLGIGGGGLDFDVTILPGSGASVGQRALLGGTVKFPNLGEDPTGAGDHPSVRTVQVSIDDPNFTEPFRAEVDFKSGTWRADLGGLLPAGSHTAYVRAAIDRTYSNVASAPIGILGNTLVQWQLTKTGGLPIESGWHTANGFTNWSFQLPASSNGTIHVRVLSAGVEVARTSMAATGGKAPLPATGVGGDTAGLLLLIVALFTIRWMRRGTPGSVTG